MPDLPQLHGGPADGMVLPSRYADAPRIQLPIKDGRGNFATYAKAADDPTRFLFQGFTN